MTRDMVLKGAWYVDKHPDRLTDLIKTVAIGKLYAPQVSFEIVQKVMMWFGAVSYSKEFDIEMGLRGLMSYLVGAEGSLNMMRVLLGRELLGKEFIPYK
jgi:acyl-CoA dehydrogenase